jgi:hypothetical protein
LAKWAARGVFIIEALDQVQSLLYGQQPIKGRFHQCSQKILHGFSQLVAIRSQWQNYLTELSTKTMPETQKFTWSDFIVQDIV